MHPFYPRFFVFFLPASPDAWTTLSQSVKLQRYSFLPRIIPGSPLPPLLLSLSPRSRGSVLSGTFLHPCQALSSRLSDSQRLGPSKESPPPAFLLSPLFYSLSLVSIFSCYLQSFPHHPPPRTPFFFASPPAVPCTSVATCPPDFSWSFLSSPCFSLP